VVALHLRLAKMLETSFPLRDYFAVRFGVAHIGKYNHEQIKHQNGSNDFWVSLLFGYLNATTL